MRDTVVDVTDIGEDHKLEPIAGKPGKFSQQMNTLQDGKQVAKGAELVLFERGLLAESVLLPDTREALREC